MFSELTVKLFMGVLSKYMKNLIIKNVFGKEINTNILTEKTNYLILSCVLLAALSNLLPASVNAHWPSLFIFEALAIFALGMAFILKQ